MSFLEILLILVIQVLIIGLVFSPIWLSRRLVRVLAPVAGSQARATYFVFPQIGWIFLLPGIGIFIAADSKWHFKNLIVLLVGLAIMVHIILDEWRISKHLYEIRHGLQVDVGDRASEHNQYSTDMHRAAGVNSSHYVKVLTCPSCLSHCILPMGHAIACAGCGNMISFAAQSVVEASALAKGSVLTSENANQEKLRALEQTHSVEGRPIWGDTTIVKFICHQCGKQSVGYANQPRQCTCGATLTTADIVTSQNG